MNKYHIVVDIHNATSEQVGEFQRMFAWMNYCGMAGCSRSAKVVYDGDGNARLKISINGTEVKAPLGSIEDLIFDFE
jgi:hypothetical protein